METSGETMRRDVRTQGVTVRAGIALSLLLMPLFASGQPAMQKGSVEGPVFISGDDPCPKGLRWEPVKSLSDEFAGERVDSEKWQTEPRANGWGWIGRPPGIFQAKNVTVEDGEMQVQVGVLDEPVEYRKKYTYTYYGGIIRSVHSGQVGWYYECRMKANHTEMSSTFWLMSKDDPIKKLELDIQECVGKTSELSDDWARDWDHIYHSNAIHRRNRHNPEQKQQQAYVELPEKNCSRFFVYGAWWKSADEIRFYLDGKYMYSIHPDIAWDVPAHLHMAVETYDWNPVPADGGLVASGTQDERTTRYDWIRTWKLVAE